MKLIKIRYKIIILLTMLMLVLIVPVQVNAGSEVIIHVLSHSGTVGKAINLMTKMFNEEYKGEYRAVLTPWGVSSDIYDKAIRMFIARQDSFDVIPIVDRWTPAYGMYLEPLDPYFRDFGPADPSEIMGGAKIFMYDGNTIGLPFRFGTAVLAYRKDLFEEYNIEVPKTYEELKEIAIKLTKKDSESGEVERYGFALPMHDGSRVQQSINWFYYLPGGAWLNDDQTKASPTLTSEYAVERLEYIKSLLDEGVIPPPLGFSHQDRGRLAYEDKLAMCILLTRYAAYFEDPEISGTAGKWGYVTTPLEQVGPYPAMTIGDGWAFGINKMCQNKEAAYKYIKFIATNYEAQLHAALETANDPPLFEVLESEEYLTRFPFAKAALESFKTFPSVTTIDLVVQSEELIRVNLEEIHSFILGRQDAPETLDNMARRYEDILK